MEDILDQLEDNEDRYYEYANNGIRFANYIIDVIAFYFIAFIIGLVFAMFTTDEQALDDLFLEPTAQEEFIQTLLSIALFVGYYVVFEYFFKGKTIGKLITRSRAVTNDNATMSFKTTLIRSLSRIIPFEPLSFFGSRPDSGWHDQISKSKVIMDEGWIDSGPDRF